MPDTVTLVTALILECPLCMLCLRDKSGLTSEQVGVALGFIESVLKVRREQTGRCQACGVSGLVVSSERPRRVSGWTATPEGLPLQREVRRLIEENGELLQRLATASREIERLQTKVVELSRQRRFA
jgi:hypothetical protein